MDKIRLLIVSEDSSARRGLTAIFASEDVFKIVGNVAFAEAIEKAASFQPDVILLDIADDLLQQGDNIIQIKSECPCSMIIALVENEQCSKITELIAHGIDGCVPKGIMRICLVKTVELACRAGIFCLPGSFKKVFTSVNNEHATDLNLNKGYITAKNSEVLTKREMEILQLMARNSTNREIANQLFISEPTVKTHVSSILRKLGQNNRAQAIIYSYKIGLVNESPLVNHK